MKSRSQKGSLADSSSPRLAAKEDERVNSDMYLMVIEGAGPVEPKTTWPITAKEVSILLKRQSLEFQRWHQSLWKRRVDLHLPLRHQKRLRSKVQKLKRVMIR
jgi:hypothetical protein